MDMEKVHFLKEDMLIVYPPTNGVVEYVYYERKNTEAEKRYNSMIYKIAKRKAILKGSAILAGLISLFVLANWIVFLCGLNELTILTTAFMDFQFIRLIFVVAEDCFSTSFLTHVKYKGKDRNIIF